MTACYLCGRPIASLTSAPAILYVGAKPEITAPSFCSPNCAVVFGKALLERRTAQVVEKAGATA